MNASHHVHLCMASRTCHAVQHERRLLWLPCECTDYGVHTLCCCLCRAEHVFCFLLEVCVFSCGPSSLFHFRLCCIKRVLVVCYLCTHMALHHDSVWSHVISLKACKCCSMLHRNFNNILEHIRVLVREAADWLCLAHVFWCFFSSFQWN